MILILIGSFVLPISDVRETKVQKKFYQKKKKKKTFDRAAAVKV
jgi:hypothetical protein